MAVGASCVPAVPCLPPLTCTSGTSVIIPTESSQQKPGGTARSLYRAQVQAPPAPAGGRRGGRGFPRPELGKEEARPVLGPHLASLSPGDARRLLLRRGALLPRAVARGTRAEAGFGCCKAPLPATHCPHIGAGRRGTSPPSTGTPRLLEEHLVTRRLQAQLGSHGRRLRQHLS